MGKSLGGNGKQKSEWKPKGACWNCGRKGHKHDQCLSPHRTTLRSWAPEEGRHCLATWRARDQKKENSANGMQPQDEDGAWVVCPANRYNSDGDSIPDLLDIESNPEDWFSEVDEDNVGASSSLWLQTAFSPCPTAAWHCLQASHWVPCPSECDPRPSRMYSNIPDRFWVWDISWLSTNVSPTSGSSSNPSNLLSKPFHPYTHQ